jgi:hypothetical protein
MHPARRRAGGDRALQLGVKVRGPGKIWHYCACGAKWRSLRHRVEMCARCRTRYSRFHRAVEDEEVKRWRELEYIHVVLLGPPGNMPSSLSPDQVSIFLRG